MHADVSRERRTLVDAHARARRGARGLVAHEIRNPITAAKSLVQQMGEDPTARENVEYAQVALAELERVERSHLAPAPLRARGGASRSREMQLGDVVDAALDHAGRAEHAARRRASRRDVDCAGELPGDAEKLRRVLINLIGNALDAFAEAKTPAPRLERPAGENLAGSEVWLRVRDNGPGMDAERLRRIFEPFFTSKATGTGLGLAITQEAGRGARRRDRGALRAGRGHASSCSRCRKRRAGAGERAMSARAC